MRQRMELEHRISSTTRTKNVKQQTNINGMKLVCFSYAPYGSTKETETTYPHVGFSSEFYDDNSSCYYFTYRYYIPALGKWTCVDPSINEKEQNRLCFCLNQPNNYIDENGLSVVEPPYYIISKERGKIYLSIDACTIHLIVGHNNSGSKLGLNSLHIFMHTAKDGTKCSSVSLLGCNSREIDDDSNINPAPIPGIIPPENLASVYDLEKAMPNYIEMPRKYAKSLAKYPCYCKQITIWS